MIYFEYEPAEAAAYFAAEEYIMQTVRPAEAALLLWRIDDTVVIGANQLARAECDLAYAEAAGVTIARRPSGGGAIFSDRQTLEYTIILPYGAGEDAKSFVREWLAPPVIAAIARSASSKFILSESVISETLPAFFSTPMLSATTFLIIYTKSVYLAST